MARKTGTDQLIHQLKGEFEKAGNPKKSEQMSAYMKGKFVYYGIQSTERRKIQREWMKVVKDSGIEFWELMDALWDMEQREYQYVALDLLKKVPKNGFEIEDIEALEHLITTKSWWDTVDLIASNAVGRYCLQFPEKRDITIDHWRNNDNMWLNRSCLIFQLKYKDQTNFKLLKSLIQQFQFENEFFIQKAIGWSLREYSKTNPDGVRNFIQAIGLTGLAYREGSKYL